VSLDWLQDQGADAHLLFFAATAFPKDQPKVVGVAVSGGSDSMATLHLMVRAGQHCGWQVRAVTVDHRLRPEAADEAAFVGRACAGLGVPHDVLVWEHGAVAGNLQDLARRARYGLIGDWARAQGIGHVMLGHTADDQAETFLMGLAREAGLDGLSGMRRSWVEGSVTYHRRFLLQERADLRAYLTRNGLAWIDDPSNENDRFTRVKARRVLKALKPLGITVEKLSGVVGHLADAQTAIKQMTHETAERICKVDAGVVALERLAWRLLPHEIGRRLLIQAVQWVSRAEYAPRSTAMFRVMQAIGEKRDTTLSGCRIRVSDAEIRIMREPKAVAGVACDTDQLWDGRWRMDGPHAPGLEIRALGAEGLRACKDWRSTGLPRDVLIVSPAIWEGDTLIAAPLAGKSDGWTATIPAGFGLFAVSH
jgi:tRNA(Ile)-lysidine synthase